DVRQGEVYIALAGSAGLAKSTPGTVLLDNTNAYSGPTAVSNGVLLVNGSIAAGAATVYSGGTLGGKGTVNGAVTVQSGGTLSPGTSLGLLTISNTLALQAGSSTFMELDQAAGTNDVVRISGNVSYGGTLMVTNLAGTLAVSNAF